MKLNFLFIQRDLFILPTKEGNMMSKNAPRDYSLIAPLYDQIFQRFLAQGHVEIGQLLKKVKNKRGIKVLEIGVGSGLSLSHLPSAIDYKGIDINEKMLIRARKKAEGLNRRKIALELMDAENLTMRDNSYDLVMAASVITAVDSPIRTMKEMIRVTKKGGHIAVIANLRETSSIKSDFVKFFDPITRKYLGFRTDLDLESIKKLRNVKLVEHKKVNNVFGFPLSSFLLFQKT